MFVRACVRVGVCVCVCVCVCERREEEDFRAGHPDHRFRLRRTDTAPVWILSDESMTRVCASDACRDFSRKFQTGDVAFAVA